MQTSSISWDFTLQVVHTSFCKEAMALAALACSQKLPCSICNANFHDLLKVAHSKRHCQNPVNMQKSEITTRMQVVPQKNSWLDRMYTGHALSSHKCPMRFAQLLRLDCWHDAAACTISTMPTSWSVKRHSRWHDSEQMSCDPPATQCRACPTGCSILSTFNLKSQHLIICPRW